MNRTLVGWTIALLLGAAVPTIATEDDEVDLIPAQQARLPGDWLGRWEGEMVRPSIGKRPELRFRKSLDVRPIQGSDDRTWVIRYSEGDEYQKPREYVIKPDPGQLGRYLLDENNGVVLDHLLMDDVLHSAFEVGGNVITTRYERTEEGIAVEMVVYNARTPRVSDNTALVTKSYPVLSVQRGLLTRAKRDSEEETEEDG